MTMSASACERRRPAAIGGLTLVALLLAAASPASATTVVPKSFDQTAAEAGAIFVGRVVDVTSRWQGENLDRIQTEYTLVVDEAVQEKGPVAKGRTVKLRFWGGTVGDVSQVMVGVPEMTRGRRYVLMTRPGRSKSGASPLVGFWHGFFPVVDRYGAKADVVVDHAGAPMFSLAGKRIARYSKAAGAKDVDGMLSLNDFLGLLRTDLPRIKSLKAVRPSLRPSTGPKPYARPLSKTTGPAPAPKSIGPPRGLPLKRVFAPPIPPASPPVRVAARLAALEKRELPLGVKAPGSGHFFVGYCKLPAVINPLPMAGAPWAPIDQECMGYWNFYLKDAFQISETPAVAARFGDESWDIHGLLGDADFKQRFGADNPECTGWDDGVLGVTMSWRKGNREGVVAGEWKTTEADIALNAKYSWTLDDEKVFDGADLISYRQTMTHELGHVLGLDHNFWSLAIMNYAPNDYRAFYLPFLMDVEAIRARYELGHVHRADLAIHLFTCTLTNKWYDALIRSDGGRNQAVAGGQLRIADYALENLGTDPVAEPTVEWYLTKKRDLEGEKYHLATAKYPTLPGGRTFDSDSLGRDFAVPANVPSGDYYVAAFIRDDYSPQLRGFPWNNNTAFSREKIRVRR